MVSGQHWAVSRIITCRNADSPLRTENDLKYCTELNNSIAKAKHIQTAGLLTARQLNSYNAASPRFSSPHPATIFGWLVYVQKEFVHQLCILEPL